MLQHKAIQHPYEQPPLKLKKKCGRVGFHTRFHTMSGTGFPVSSSSAANCALEAPGLRLSLQWPGWTQGKDRGGGGGQTAKWYGRISAADLRVSNQNSQNKIFLLFTTIKTKTPGKIGGNWDIPSKQNIKNAGGSCKS